MENLPQRIPNQIKLKIFTVIFILWLLLGSVQEKDKFSLPTNFDPLEGPTLSIIDFFPEDVGTAAFTHLNLSKELVEALIEQGLIPHELSWAITHLEPLSRMPIVGGILAHELNMLLTSAIGDHGEFTTSRIRDDLPLVFLSLIRSVEGVEIREIPSNNATKQFEIVLTISSTQVEDLINASCPNPVVVGGPMPFGTTRIIINIEEQKTLTTRNINPILSLNESGKTVGLQLGIGNQGGTHISDGLSRIVYETTPSEQVIEEIKRELEEFTTANHPEMGLRIVFNSDTKSFELFFPDTYPITTEEVVDLEQDLQTIFQEIIIRMGLTPDNITTETVEQLT